MRSVPILVSVLSLMLLSTGCGDESSAPDSGPSSAPASASSSASSSASPSGGASDEGFPSDTTPPGTQFRYGEPASVPGVADANHRYQVAVLGVRKGRISGGTTWHVRLKVSPLSKLSGESVSIRSFEVTDGRGQPMATVDDPACPPLPIDGLSPGGKPMVGCLAFERAANAAIAMVAYVGAPYASQPITWVRP